MKHLENRILIIDDNPNIHNDIKSVLTITSEDKMSELESELFGKESAQPSTLIHSNYTIDSAYSGQEGLEKLIQASKKNKPYSLVFTDVRMPPGIDGITTTRQLLEIDPNIQVVICSAYSDHSWQDMVNLLGVSDRWLILKKPFELIEIRQMAYALCEKWLLQNMMQQKITEKTLFLNQANEKLTAKVEDLKKAHEEINYLAYFDGLTNLPNRNFFYLEAERLFNKAHKKKQHVALMYLDLDDFKHVNDTLGHNAGDKLLRKVTDKLQKSLRNKDFIDVNLARMGGDEFIILLSSIANVKDVDTIAKRVLDTVAHEYFIADSLLTITASVGIAIYPDDGLTVDTLLKNADAAMYAAKKMGKNAHQFYNKSFKYDTQQRLTIENELRQALINQELCLHYQPKYQVSDKKIAGLEALLRWQHPVRGLLYPNDFIKVAEELGIMVPIGNWVFKTACEHIKQLHNKGLDHLKVSVNLSTIQFHTPDLITFIKNLLEQVDLNSKYLEFELTERMIMFNQEYTFEALNKLKDIGISLSIDDFGTGFSSLSHLSTLPIDTVKIDQSFVDLIDKQGSSPILDSIIDLSHNLDYTVIAEGVETELEYQYLLEKGCDEMQGFLFSKPITFEALTRTLQVDS